MLAEQGLAGGTLTAFAADLASRSDDELLRLFRRRPDAIAPPVATFADLASRLSTMASVDLALDQLTLPQLRALVTMSSGGTDTPGSLMGQLCDVALVIRADPSMVSSSNQYDGGTRLFLPLTAVAGALRELGADSSAGAADCGAGAAGSDVGDALLAVEPSPHLNRSLHLTPSLHLPPDPQLTPVPPAIRENAVGSAAETLVRTAGAVLSAVEATGIATLRAGTLGVRTLRQLSKALTLDQPILCFYLELLASAHLIVFDANTRGWRWNAAEWSELDRSEQWHFLVTAWLENTRPPASAITPLSPHESHRHAKSWRRQVLHVMAGLSGDSAVIAENSLHLALSWHHPRAAASLGAVLPALLHEMEWLGLTGAGALSDPGRALSDPGFAVTHGDAPHLAVTRMRQLLPPPVDRFILQGDLTAVVPGHLHPTVAATLRRMARAEGQGAASIFRFSQHSLQAAAASGMSQAAMLAFLHDRSSTPVPQSLNFLIAELSQDSTSTSRSGPDAGAVAVSASGTTAPARRSLRRTPRRAATGMLEPGAGVAHQESSEQRAVLAQLQLAQIQQLRSQSVWANAGVGESGPALVMEQLRQAVDHGRMVRVAAVTGTGDVEELLLLPVSLRAGMLRATVPGPAAGTTQSGPTQSGTQRERHISIHRIASVHPAPAAPEATAPVPSAAEALAEKEHHG